MVMAESVSFIWERGRPARLFSVYPFLLVQTSGGTPASQQRSVQSKSLRSVMQGMHQIDRRPRGGDSAFWLHLLALMAFGGARPVATTDA